MTAIDKDDLEFDGLHLWDVSKSVFLALRKSDLDRDNTDKNTNIRVTKTVNMSCNIVVAYISQRRVTYTVFWISNSISILFIY